MAWLKKMLLEKWVGRLIVLALAAVSGWLAKLNVDEATIATWVEATRALLEVLLPILVAWIFGSARLKLALNTPPPEK